MRALVLLLPLALLVAACGGGGGGAGPAVIPIVSNVVQAIAPDHRAVFDVNARLRWSGTPLPIDVTGTLVIENEGAEETYPLDPGRAGWRMRHTLTLEVPALLQSQNPDLPPEVTVVLREFVEVAGDGSWYTLGGEVEDARTDPPTLLRSWWASPMLVEEPTLYPAQVIEQGPVDVLAEDLVTVLGSRETSRTVATATEVVATPIGSFECYRATLVETLTGTAEDATPVPVTYTRWQRPDRGLVRLLANGYRLSGEYGGTPYTIDVDRLEALLRTLAP